MTLADAVPLHRLKQFGIAAGDDLLARHPLMSTDGGGFVFFGATLSISKRSVFQRFLPISSVGTTNELTNYNMKNPLQKKLITHWFAPGFSIQIKNQTPVPNRISTAAKPTFTSVKNEFPSVPADEGNAFHEKNNSGKTQQIMKNKSIKLGTFLRKLAAFITVPFRKKTTLNGTPASPSLPQPSQPKGNNEVNYSSQPRQGIRIPARMKFKTRGVSAAGRRFFVWECPETREFIATVKEAHDGVKVLFRGYNYRPRHSHSDFPQTYSRPSRLSTVNTVNA